MKTAGEATATVEEYLETIYNMAMEGSPAIGARLADRFLVAPPTVSNTLNRMRRDGYIDMDQRRIIHLTEKGLHEAERILRRHRLTERFLVDVLGMQWHEVHEEACRLEHYISDAVEARVVGILDHPVTCPHGNPIPGLVPDARSYLLDKGAIRLPEAHTGDKCQLLCVSEIVEDEAELISYLQDHLLLPGCVFTINQIDEPADKVSLSISKEETIISFQAAQKLWVVRE